MDFFVLAQNSGGPYRASRRPVESAATLFSSVPENRRLLIAPGPHGRRHNVSDGRFAQYMAPPEALSHTCAVGDAQQSA
jgi:hypothetical protein